VLSRELKLKLTKKQENQLNDWLPTLTSIYNWAIRKIELNSENRIYFNEFDFKNLLPYHSVKLNIPSHVIQGILNQAYIAWKRCFKNLTGKPKLKSIRNKLNSIPFPDPISATRINNKTIKLLGVGRVKYYKQEIPSGVVKCGRIIKRASGWYLQLIISNNNKFPVKNTIEKVGVDTGFNHLAILSNGIKIENERNYIKGQSRLAQAQRGKRKQLAARLNERIKNRRKDYNHKIYRKIVGDYKEIYITKDNLRSQSKVFGKSVTDAGISQLRNFIIYKGDNHDRKVELVDSKFTTMTCSNCGSLTGPSGLKGLVVRDWECSICGIQHDRDINSAKVILNLGLGCSLDNAGTHAVFVLPETSRLEYLGEK
jgi:putative transposase